MLLISFYKSLFVLVFFYCRAIISCMVVQESRDESRSVHATEEVTGAPLTIILLHKAIMIKVARLELIVTQYFLLWGT